VSAAQRVTEIGGVAGTRQLHGYELHASSAEAALDRLARQGFDARIQVVDFFDIPPDPSYDAVMGNPPYVRYQDFTGPSRARSRAAALRAGVGLTGLASAWAAFTVHAAEFCRPGGRLGLVLPAELLSVNYAADVRRYLMATFGRVRLVLFTERVFPGVLEEVVLLLAEDARAPGDATYCELHQLSNVSDLASLTGAHRWQPAHGGSKWTLGLLPTAAAMTYATALNEPNVVTLHAWGETTLGIVTGNNSFSALTTPQVAALGLTRADVVPVSPPGSRHLRGLELSTAEWMRLEMWRPGPGCSGRLVNRHRPRAP
jgi:hypothetical protein